MINWKGVQYGAKLLSDSIPSMLYRQIKSNLEQENVAISQKIT